MGTFGASKTDRTKVHAVILFLRRKRIERRIPTHLIHGAIGVSGTAIHRWEAGTVSPRMAHIDAYARYMGYELALKRLE